MAQYSNTVFPRKNALIIVDMQNDFCPPNGSLAVKEADIIIPLINTLRNLPLFDIVVFTQDFHPANHCSFYENNKNNPLARPFQILNLPKIGPQMMWPVHCVQGSYGTQFHPKLDIRPNDIIVQKGLDPSVDSYSGFFDNQRLRKTELDNVLKLRGVTDVYLCGVAADYCVGYSALDAISLLYKTYLIADCTSGVDPQTTNEMMNKLKLSGVEMIYTSSLMPRSSTISTPIYEGVPIEKNPVKHTPPSQSSCCIIS